MIIKSNKEKEDAYLIKHEENFLIEITKSRLNILTNNKYNKEDLLKEVVMLNINKINNKIGFSISFFVPSKYGNMRSEYEVGNKDRVYFKKHFIKGYNRLAKKLDRFFDYLYDGEKSTEKVFGKGSKEVSNYKYFIDTLESCVTGIMEILPEVVINYYNI